MGCAWRAIACSSPTRRPGASSDTARGPTERASPMPSPGSARLVICNDRTKISRSNEMIPLLNSTLRCDFLQEAFDFFPQIGGGGILLFDRGGDRRRAPVDFLHALGISADGLDGAAGRGLNGRDLRRNLFCRVSRLDGEHLYFRCHDGEASARLACPGGGFAVVASE